jgi:hypothetical protein
MLTSHNRKEFVQWFCKEELEDYLGTFAPGREV